MTDAGDIQAALCSHYSDWYATPVEQSPVATALGDPASTWWQALVTETADMSSTFPQSPIPPDLITKVQASFKRKASPALQKQLRHAMTSPLTLHEYHAAIKHLRHGSAGGPSALTPSVIKSWSPSITSFVFRHLNVLWMTKTTPEWMKDKLIRLVPKSPGATDLNNMRPISLYETLRKIMTTIVARRIHLIWETSGILNPNQYGYRLHSGTPMPLYNVLNHIEAAHVNHETTFITFWDIRRAFDSIPRNLQRLAWMRLGLTVEDAEWFANMDDGGLSYLITPCFEESATFHPSHTLHTDAAHFHTSNDRLSFQAQRGIGQGESASSLVWVALYDILLDLLQDTLKKDGSLNAFADDLASITTGPNSL